MSSERVERRLAAVLSADAVGYSRLMSGDDEATVRTLQAHRKRIERLIGTFRGRVVDTPGDNLLAEFPSALASVRAALEIQRDLGVENQGLPEDRRMPFRIGIHLGDVIVDGASIFGDGINIAARLERLAEPGGLCLSDLVYQQVRRKLSLAVIDLGEQELKNIDEPVRAYQIGQADQDAPVRNIARAAEPKALPRPDKPSLAVKPFINLSGDTTQEYFNDGLYNEFMTELARIPGLFVIAQDAMFTYKSTGVTPREVARELGVRYVLEGAVHKQEKRVRITARLVDADSGQVVWAERYDRALEDVFAVQDEIVQEIVTALDVALVSGESAITIRKHMHNLQAIGLLFQGSDLMHRFTREDMIEARHRFEEVIRLEPACPFGYADAAWTHYFDVERGWSRDPSDSLDRMEELARKAMEVGDVSGYGHLMLGNMYLMRRQHDEALAMSEEALRERPSCQAAYGLKANILNYSGLPDDAIPLAKQSIRLSPVAQTFFPEVLATSYYLSGHLEDAIAAAQQTLGLAPDSLDARVVLAASLVETGRLDAAQEAAREILALDPSFKLNHFSRSQPYRDQDQLDRLLDSARKAGLQDGDQPELPSDVIPIAQRYGHSRRRVAPRPQR